jgi:hypothetical protein
MANNFQQGYYNPKHPQKYVGNVDKIIYRSSWELQMNQFLDNNPNVLHWSSEEIAIPYVKPTDQKIHRYYPDYWVQYVNSAGKVIQEILEVKPAAQLTQSKSRNPKTKLYENLTFAINSAKWEQAKKWCDDKGIKFRLITERDIFR